MAEEKISPFDFVESITETKKNLMVDEASEKAYNPYMVNLALSMYADTILYANEMNINHHLENRMQYKYLLEVIRPRKRRSGKWPKPEKDEELTLIMEYFDYGVREAREALSVLTSDQLKLIKKKLDRGGERRK